MYVIGLINAEYLPRDIFMHNCVELMKDLGLGTHLVSARWISRDDNGVCDALAR